MAEIKDRIRSERIKKDINQPELAKIMNVSKQTVSNWENGNRIPDVYTLSKLADLFNCTVDYLLGKTDKPIYEKVEPKKGEIVVVDPKLMELLENSKDLPGEAITNLNEIAKNLKNSYEIIEYKKDNDKLQFILNKDVKPDGLTEEELEKLHKYAKDLKRIKNEK